MFRTAQGEAGAAEGGLELCFPTGGSLARRRCGDSRSQVARGLKSPRQTPPASLQALLPPVRPFKDSGTFSPAARVTVAVSIALPSVCRAADRCVSLSGARAEHPTPCDREMSGGGVRWVSEQRRGGGSDLPRLVNCAEKVLGAAAVTGPKERKPQPQARLWELPGATAAVRERDGVLGVRAGKAAFDKLQGP